MNLLSARRLHLYLLPTEHLNPHLGDPLMNHVSYTKSRECKVEEGSRTPPLSFLQYLALPTLTTLAFPLHFSLLAGNRSTHNSRPTKLRPSQPGLESVSSWAHPGLCIPLLGN